MLCPGLEDIFSLFTCSKKYPCPADYKGPKDITWETWLVCLGSALGVFVVHFLFKLFIKPKGEFKVSLKKIQNDLLETEKREK